MTASIILDEQACKFSSQFFVGSAMDKAIFSTDWLHKINLRELADHSFCGAKSFHFLCYLDSDRENCFLCGHYLNSPLFQICDSPAVTSFPS